MQRLTFGTDGTSGPLRCAKDHAHPLQIVRSNDRLIGWCRTCFDFAAPGYDVLGSLAWYDDHDNLWLLFDWLGDMSASGFRSVVEKPWHYEDEFAVAKAAREHEASADGHEVWHDGTSDVDAYCNSEKCPWRCRSGAVSYDCPFCGNPIEEETDREQFGAHVGCLADVAHDDEPERFDMSGATRGAER